MKVWKFKNYLENSLYNAALLMKTSRTPFPYKLTTIDGIRNRLRKMDAETSEKLSAIIWGKEGNIFDDSLLTPDERFMLYMRYQFVFAILEGIEEAESAISIPFIDIEAPSDKLDTFLFISLWNSLGYMWIECAARIIKNGGFPPYGMTEQTREMFVLLSAKEKWKDSSKNENRSTGNSDES